MCMRDSARGMVHIRKDLYSPIQLRLEWVCGYGCLVVGSRDDIRLALPANQYQVKLVWNGKRVALYTVCTDERFQLKTDPGYYWGQSSKHTHEIPHELYILCSHRVNVTVPSLQTTQYSKLLG